MSRQEVGQQAGLVTADLDTGQCSIGHTVSITGAGNHPSRHCDLQHPCYTQPHTHSQLDTLSSVIAGK